MMMRSIKRNDGMTWNDGRGAVLDGDPVRPSPPGRYASLKVLSDAILAAALLVLLSPLILLALAAVRLTSRGPVIYSQVRSGLGGRPFIIYKIRTMYDRCEEQSGPRWCALRGDRRVTPVGGLLRAFKIDELPQLWNVLRGEMSLVGPRPERPEIIVELERVIPYYTRRLLVRPGLTGLAQVQLPADTDIESVRHKLACDLYYIHNLRPLMDARILLSTATYLLGVPFWVSMNLLRVPSREIAEHAYRRMVKLDGPQVRPA